MTAAEYVTLWTQAASAPRWVLDNLYPFLCAAGAVRIVTFIYSPRR